MSCIGRRFTFLSSVTGSASPFYPLRVQQFVDRAARLIDGRVGIGAAARIRVGDGNSAEGCSAAYIGPLRRRHVRFVQRVVFRRIAMRPAIDGDGLDVARGIKSTRTQGARKLVTYVVFECRKGGPQQLGAADFVLLEFS